MATKSGENRTMRILPTLLAITALFISASHGQSSARKHGLVMTGAVTGVTAVYNVGSEQPLFSYQVTLIMQIRNDGDSPLIIFTPTRYTYMDKRVMFFDNFPNADDSSASVYPTPWVNEVVKYFKDNDLPDPRPAFFRGIDSREPWSSMILGPGKIYEFTETVTVDDGYSLRVRPKQTRRQAVNNAPTPEYPALKIQYRLSAKKHHPNDGLFTVLRERWKRFGTFVLDENGDFLLTSDVIVTG